MIQYLDLLRHVMEHGKFKVDRTGTGTHSVFGAQARHPLADGFPLVTTNKVHSRSIIHELLWFLRDDTKIKYRNEIFLRATPATRRLPGAFGPHSFDGASTICCN